MSSVPSSTGGHQWLSRASTVVASAPGRINLIGEFTDYNDGWVLPFALDRRTTATVGARSDRTVTVTTSMLPAGHPDASVSVPEDELVPGAVAGWAAYALGVVWSMRSAGLPVGGVDIHLDSDVPIGAGLSSSAALECAVAVALDALFATGRSRRQLAALARSAENDFVGVPSGIMDQTASLRAEAGNALLVDTRSLEVRQIPFDPAGAGLAVLVIDTGVQHELGSSAYGERRQTCIDSAATLGVVALRDIPADRLADALSRLPDDVARRRVCHVVLENRRVLTVADRLAAGDLRGIGPVLSATHTSLRKNFEVSCAELDLAVDTALAAGALGARMIGGGFGGSAIALVEVDGVTTTSAAVGTAFSAAGYRPPTTFLASPAEGAAVQA